VADCHYRKLATQRKRIVAFPKDGYLLSLLTLHSPFAKSHGRLGWFDYQGDK
jgi:hypothetical protein